MKSDISNARQELESVNIDKELTEAQLELKEKENQRSKEDVEKSGKKIVEMNEQLEKIRSELVAEKIKNEEKPEALKIGSNSKSEDKNKEEEESESDDRDYSKLELEHLELLGRL